MSYSGNTIPIGGANPQPVQATLTGVFSPLTVTLFDGTIENISPSTFSVQLLSSSGGGANLNDLDFTVFSATATPAVSSVPEANASVLLATCILAIAFTTRRAYLSRIRNLLRPATLARFASGILCVLLVQVTLFGATATVHLNANATPATGVATGTSATITGDGYPTGVTAAEVNVAFATTCGATPAATTIATKLQHIVSTINVVQFQVPSTLTAGTYFVSVSGSVGTTTFASNNCSSIGVTKNSTALAACVPTSSLGVSAPVNPGPVTAYVPNGAWCCGSTGIQVVQLEAGGGPAISPVSIPTSANVNSCTANPNTNVAVCVDNGTGVYVINGSSLTATLKSGANGFAGFSGGSCENCGVAMNALNNTAIIGMGLAGSPSSSGIQFLNLNTNTFGPAVPTSREISEDIAIDPTRGYILSPNEGSNYDILQFNPSNAVTEFTHTVVRGGELDSAAEDCSTGIALASIEFTNNVYLTDLTQAIFTPGSPGSWSAPENTITLTTAYGFSAGTSGISVAPGTTHLGVITGEFGGSSFTVLQLPVTSGSGTPALVDYANAFIPGFSAGYDPHTVTAYTSPNTGKAFGVFADWSTGTPARLAIVDLAAILAAPRLADGHSVNQTVFNVLTSGAITFVNTH